MNSRRFDRFTRAFGARLTRREALAASAAGLAGAGLASRSSGTAAQDATPVPPSVAKAGGPSFLFVQLAESGTWTPKPNAGDGHTLTLIRASGQTLFFSDRPERIVGAVPVERFLGTIGFSPESPPNAAVVVETPEGERDVLVVALSNPVYSQQFDEDGGDSITYDAQLLDAYDGEGLVTWVAEQADDQLPERFSNVSLFIDDCADVRIGCRTTCDEPGELLGTFGFCWNWSTFVCEPCVGWTQLDYECNNSDKITNCDGCCSAYYYGKRDCRSRC